MPVLPIVTGQDNPALRVQCEPVPQVTKEVLKLVKDMEKTVQKADGAGLAAPQVGRTERICLCNLNGRMTTLINPEVTVLSDEVSEMEEGCLSLPGVWLKVTRPNEISVKYLDPKGIAQERRLSGFEAHVVQHEVDHLNGVLIVDYDDAVEFVPG